MQLYQDMMVDMNKIKQTIQYTIFEEHIYYQGNSSENNWSNISKSSNIVFLYIVCVSYSSTFK